MNKFLPRACAAAFLLMTTSSLPAAAPNASAALALDPAAAKPPAAEKHPKTVGLHGDKITDDYFWLREKGTPAVAAYLEAENAYTAAVMAPFKPLEEGLYAEMIGRIKQTDVSVPYLQRGYWLYERTEEGKQYRILCRKKGSTDEPEEVVLDVNKLAEGQKFMSLGSFAYSDDNTLLAYSTDINGHRDYEFHLKRLADGMEIKTPIGKIADVEWAADNKTLFYVTEDESKRSYRLYRYTLGDKEPALVFEEKDEMFDVALGRSHDGKFLFAGAYSKRSGEMSFLPADQPKGDFALIAPRRAEILYFPEHRAGVFYIRTNDKAKEYRVVTAPVATPGADHWREYLAGRPGVKVEDFEPFAKYAVVTERAEGLVRFNVMDFADKSARLIPLPEQAYDAEGAFNPEFDVPVFRYNYQSPVTPPSVYEYPLAGGEPKLLKRTEILGGYDPSKYVVERLQAPAADGTKIPLDVVRRKDVALDGKAPCWLYGYGSYGVSIDPSFSGARVSLLDRGLVYAIAHIRGGGELGESWRDAGRMMTKKNTFTDFIACADYLAASKYTAHERLVIEGASAGGLLIGATLNLRPDVCRAALLVVPFVDVLNTMSDATLPLTTSEYIEWGNPNNKDEYDYIKTYSPYDNVAPRAYPSMLLMTSLNDSQVPYWEPAKLTAKLRALKTDKNPLIFKINLDAGHGGASGRYDRLKEVAFEYAFGLAALGLGK